MSVARRIAFGVAALWANRVAASLLGLILIPVLYDRLPEAELGLWFLLAQIGAFAGLLDFGFHLTLTRRIAVLHARSVGDGADAPANEEALHDVVATGRVLFRWIALVILVGGGLAGAVFLAAIDTGGTEPMRLLVAWGVLCVGYAIASGTGFEHGVLNGAGHVGWDAAATSVFTVATALAQIVVAVTGGGLVGLAVVTAAGALGGRVAAVVLVRRKVPGLAVRRGRARRGVVRDLSGLAVRSWLTALGAFLILKTDQAFIAYVRGAADIPAYHAAYVLVSNANQLATAFAAASSVYVSRLWSVGDLDGMHRLVWRSVRLGLGLMVAAVGYLLVCGPELFALWLGDAERFVGMPVLAAFCVMLTLETQHVILAHSCRALEVEAFAPWALGAGLLNLVLTWVLIGPYGLFGVALATLLAQLVTNNWYAVVRSLHELRMPVSAYVRRAVLPVAGLFAVVLGACFAAAAGGRAVAGALGSAAGGAVTAGVVLALFWWCVALDDSERRGVVSVVLRR